jgi:hypothetical protein
VVPGSCTTPQALLCWRQSLQTTSQLSFAFGEKVNWAQMDPLQQKAIFHFICCIFIFSVLMVSAFFLIFCVFMRFFLCFCVL